MSSLGDVLESFNARGAPEVSELPSTRSSLSPPKHDLGRTIGRATRRKFVCAVNSPETNIRTLVKCFMLADSCTREELLNQSRKFWPTKGQPLPWDDFSAVPMHLHAPRSYRSMRFPVSHIFVYVMWYWLLILCVSSLVTYENPRVGWMRIALPATAALWKLQQTSSLERWTCLRRVMTELKAESIRCEVVAPTGYVIDQRGRSSHSTGISTHLYSTDSVRADAS